MRVRVWIAGAEGPSWEFELLTAPRAGDRITISHGGEVEEGVVEAVDWHLQAVATSPQELALDGEPPGSVTLVHVICRPRAAIVAEAYEGAEADLPLATAASSRAAAGTAS